jgi:hypothetical protein
VGGRRARSSPCGASFIVARCPPCCAKESEWKTGGPATGRNQAARGQHRQTERPRVRARHAASRTPAALGVRARLGKARCLGERAASSSAARLGARAGGTARRGCAWLARRRGEAGPRPKLFRLGNFKRSFLPEQKCIR